MRAGWKSADVGAYFGQHGLCHPRPYARDRVQPLNQFLKRTQLLLDLGVQSLDLLRQEVEVSQVAGK